VLLATGRNLDRSFDVFRHRNQRRAR
jgi:hypothetical protein